MDVSGALSAAISLLPQSSFLPSAPELVHCASRLFAEWKNVCRAWIRVQGPMQTIINIRFIQSE